MKAIVLIVSITLILGTCSAMNMFDQMPLNFGPSRSILTLLTQVEVQLKNGGPLDTITKMLEDFKVQINEEQINHDNLYARQKAECASELEFRKKEITDAVGALKAAQETLDGCNAQRTRAEGDFKITKKQLNENRNYLTQIVEISQKTAYEFETDSSALQMTIKAVEEALIILEGLAQGEKGFAELTRHTHVMLLQAASMTRASYLAQVMQAFVQLAVASQNGETEIDEQALNRVKTLLQNLREKFTGEFQVVVDENDKAKALFEADKTRIEGIIKELDETQSNLQVEMANLDKCIITQQGIVSSAQAKRDRNQKLSDDATALCNSTDAEYNGATKSRKQELKLLSAIKERVEARFGQLSEGVQARGKQDNFSYDNKSAYDKKEFKKSG